MAPETNAEIIRIYERCLCPLYRRLQTRRLEVRAEARRTHSRAGYAELTALRAEISTYENRIVALRAGSAVAA